jgi:hypothetical protein
MVEESQTLAIEVNTYNVHQEVAPSAGGMDEAMVEERETPAIEVNTLYTRRWLHALRRWMKQWWRRARLQL